MLSSDSVAPFVLFIWFFLIACFDEGEEGSENGVENDGDGKTVMVRIVLEETKKEEKGGKDCTW